MRRPLSPSPRRAVPALVPGALALLPALLVGLAPGAASGAVEVKPLEGGARFEVTFRHQPVIAVKEVALAGSFNNWSERTTPMKDVRGDGVFSVTLTLPRGQHHYKFVVNGTVWIHDADNPRTDSDGHSGFNSVLELGAGQASAPGVRGDGKIAVQELIHDPDDIAMASAVDGRRRLVLRIHALKDDVERVRVLATPRPRGADADGAVTARRIATWEGRDVYEARLLWGRDPGRVRYAFQIEDGGATARFPEGRNNRFALTTAHAGRFETPDWARDAVFYQIFPDRFRDGDPNNQPDLPRRPPGTPWHIDDRYLEEWDAKPAHFNFMGGDLAGITEKADYIASLGANAIYLNPIFKAGSNHRYDASCYETIDPALGTLADFHALRDAMAERDMRLLLDCVFNHTGDSHYAFQDAMKNGPKSKYWKWFFFDGGFPVIQHPKPNYRAWWGFGTLPQLDTSNPEVIKHLMDVGKRWLAEGGHGWRLDVPNEVDAVNPSFWPDFRQRIKRQDPDAYIVGEIWTDARSWLQGDKFDAVMNYPIRSAILEFGVNGGIDAQGFEDVITQQLAIYPEPALRVQFNLLGSHDTPRILTLANNDARKVRLATTFLYAYLGPPVYYYGDEIGMTGGKDPGCRKTYPWDHEERHDLGMLEHVRKLGAARAAEPALRRGTIRFVHSEGRVSAFVREPEQGDPGRPVLCVLNAAPRGEALSINAEGLAGTPIELLTGREVRWGEGGKLELELGPYESALIALLE